MTGSSSYGTIFRHARILMEPSIDASSMNVRRSVEKKKGFSRRV